MFSFRRKPKHEPDDLRIRTSPSLPELNSQGIPWPEDLVDINSIRQEPQTPSGDATSPVPQGAAKVSFHAHEAPVPFHKPFRPPDVAGKASSRHGGPISSLYMAGPTHAFDKKALPLSASRYTQRRARIPPTFNLMVVGGKGTGKTSLLRLLLDTADLSPGASADQKAALDRFLKGTAKTTQAIETACVEICESRFDRVLFSVIDTPGLDFVEGRELKLERQVNTVIKYVDAQYADTMNEESKVIRQSKGDQHIHLCIYMIDPDSIVTAAARRASSAFPSTSKARSETTASHQTPPDLVPDTSSSADDSEDEEDGPLTMSPAEIRVIRRLAARTNTLPVIAHADSLTDEKLSAVKDAVRTGLGEAGIDFGVFGPTKKADASATTPRRQTHFAASGENGNGNGHGIPEAADSEGEEEDGEEEERRSRTVIKLRPTRHRALSRSRSRRDLSEAAEDRRRPNSPDTDKESIANVRFSARTVTKTDLAALLPFALIAPEPNKRRPRPAPVQAEDTVSVATHQPSEEGHASVDAVPQTPASAIASRTFGFLNAPPDDLKGVFVRKFRWGTVDVLDPNHCDFAALRTAVLSTHLKLLKIQTKEVLYEKYRTEKLLARRATSNISDEERQRLLEDLGL